MKRHFLILAAVAALAASFGVSEPALAANYHVCSQMRAGVAPGPRQITMQVSGNRYSLDARGCTFITATDLPELQSAGYIIDGGYRAAIVTGITAANVPSPATLTLPPGAFIQQIIVENTVAAEITGGVKIGTTAGATDVVTALTCGSSCLTFVADSALSKRVFSSTASQQLFIDGVTDMNTGSLNVTVIYGLF